MQLMPVNDAERDGQGLLQNLTYRAFVLLFSLRHKILVNYNNNGARNIF